METWYYYFDFNDRDLTKFTDGLQTLINPVTQSIRIDLFSVWGYTSKTS